MQKRSSMNTSVNTTKLPSIWGKLDLQWLYKVNYLKELRVVDYGCGRRATQEKVLIYISSQVPIIYFPYDPYWGDVDRSEMTLRCLTVYQEADLCICANVLNVIDDNEELEKIIKEVTQANYWAFQIYEGDKSGIGRESKTGCWQRNNITSYYMNLITTLTGKSCYRKGNFIYNNLNMLK